MNDFPAADLVVSTPQGLYCPQGDFHIDPSHAVARAVVTHAHGDHARSGCRHYWLAASGLGLARARIGHGAGITALAYGESADFGPVRVSLHPAGHILGSAQVRLEHQGRVWVVSGDYKRDADPSCEPFEVVPCEVFVTEATFARPECQWPDGAVVAREMLQWWQQCKADGLSAILYCYALGKAQRILAELGRLTDETAYLHQAMTPLVKIYRQAGMALLPTEPVGSQVKFFDWRGRLILAPPGAGGTSWVRRFRPCSGAFASGWMGQDSARRRAYDRGFVLSDHADWPSLLRTIEQTGARRVLAMHGQTDTLVDALRARGIDAAPLVAKNRPATA